MESGKESLQACCDCKPLAIGIIPSAILRDFPSRMMSTFALLLPCRHGYHLSLSILGILLYIVYILDLCDGFSISEMKAFSITATNRFDVAMIVRP